jgi:site-specific recombinase XerD
MTITDALERFVTQLEADGRAASTIAQRRRHVAVLAHWWADVRPCAPVAEIGHEDVAAFLSSPVARLTADGAPRKASTVNIVRASLRVFFSYLHGAGYIQDDPGRVIRRAFCGRPEPRALSGTERERFLAILEGAESTADRRDATLFRTMLRTGIRLASALTLEVDDIDFDAGEIRLRGAKGNREDRVVMADDVAELLRTHLGDKTTGSVFTSSTGNPLSPRHVQRRFQSLVKKAGIARRITPHSLRHTFGTKIYKRTGDILLVKEAMRHRSIQSTLAYARADRERVRRAIG